MNFLYFTKKKKEKRGRIKKVDRSHTVGPPSERTPPLVRSQCAAPNTIMESDV